MKLDWFTAMFWAVTVLFQLYLLFPFLMRFYHEDGPRALWLVMTTFFAGRFACFVMGASARDLAYLTVAGRVDQFIIGMFAAAALSSMEQRRQNLLAWSLAPALAATVAAVYGFHLLGGWPEEAWWKLIWVTLEGALWAWVMLAYLAIGSSMKEWGLSRLLAWLGRLSFAIFLVHTLIIAIINNLGWHLLLTGNGHADAMATTVFVALPMSLAAAALMHYGIEQPFLGMRVRYYSDMERTPVDSGSSK
jgi:peptidoglycan/LPS O-acetylase OafA/YrhL